MNAVGIICEFNPFHKGHAYLLETVREAFPEKAILCLMSGNFVQRGSLAIQEKYSRARAALEGGADLVLELPFPFSSLSAEAFAGSAVSILSRLGVCDTLAFGSEVDSVEDLSLCASRLREPSFSEAMKAFQAEHKGVGYPSARQAVYEEKYGKEPILSLANASLGVEYLLALQRMNASIRPFVVLRKGEGIRSEKTDVSFASATAVRRMILQGLDPAGLLPKASLDEMEKERESGRFPVDMESLSQTIFYLLKTRSPKELSELYGFSALCHRAKRYAGSCVTLEELVQKMNNSSFTDSRIRRGLTALLCGIPRHAEKEDPAFTLVLGAREKGRALLGEMREKGSIPVFTKPAHALRWEDPKLIRQASFCHLADEIYSMAFPLHQEEGYFLRQTPTML
ncbi:MAG: nucleotidyltransferase family protein [Clostridia bacterium]|nr:nucleotidyltransferase family protein [Clostridia bacterium]